MAFTRFPDPTNNIANLANQPVEPPATLKQKFDQIGEDLKDWNNNTFLPELESIANGDSGADNIGATPVGAGVATTIQGVVEELDAKIDTQLPTPDGSITDVKLSLGLNQIKNRVSQTALYVSDFTGANDSEKINNAIVSASAGNTIILSGSYSITTPLLVDKNIILSTDLGAILNIADGINGIIATNSFQIKGSIEIKYSAQTLNANNIGVYVGKQVLGAFVYLKDVLISGITFTNCYKSIQLESVYHIQIEKVDTFNDFVSISINKVNGIVTNPATTMKLNDVYSHGGDGSILAGSIGYDFYNIVNITVEKCITEWYQTLGYWKTIQLAILSDFYTEKGSNGHHFDTVSGIIDLKLPYCNDVANYCFKITSGTLKVTGGRAILLAGQYFLEKGASSTYIEISKPAIDVGGYVKVASGYENQNRTHIARDIELFDPPNGLTITNQGYKRTWIKRTGVVTEFNDMPYNFTVGSNSLGGFTENGLILLQYFKLGNKASLPVASSTYRGYMIRIEGGAGVADVSYICRKNAADAYEWVVVA